MFTTRSASWSMVVIIVVVLGCVTSCATSTPTTIATTPEKPETVMADFSALRGKWEGSINLRGARWPDGPERTLIIDAIDTQTGTFAGQHGVTNKNLFPIKGVLKIENSRPNIRFTTAGKAEVSLGLVAPNELRGIYNSDQEQYPIQYKKLD
jgi:hypothetical protein